MSALPPISTFRDFGHEAFLQAQRDAFALDAMHQYALRDQSGISDAAILDVQRQCALWFEMSQFWRAAAPFEREIRALIAADGAQAARPSAIVIPIRGEVA